MYRRPYGTVYHTAYRDALREPLFGPRDWAFAIGVSDEVDLLVFCGFDLQGYYDHFWG